MKVNLIRLVLELQQLYHLKLLELDWKLLVSVDNTGGVGLGTTANSAKLRVEIFLYANQVQGDGSGLFN